MSMEIAELKKVKLICSEVIELVDEVLGDYYDKPLTKLTGNSRTGGLRRRSMDLTRALAQLRKS